MTSSQRPRQPDLKYSYRYRTMCLAGLRTRIGRHVQANAGLFIRHHQLAADIGFFLIEATQRSYPDPKPIQEQVNDHHQIAKEQVNYWRHFEAPQLRNLSLAEELHELLAAAAHHARELVQIHQQLNIGSHPDISDTRIHGNP